MSYGAEGLGDGEASDERVSGAFYIGRGTFRMETLEGGIVSAPLIGALTPARGIGYLPVDDWQGTSGTQEQETPQDAWSARETDQRPRRTVVVSPSLVVLIAVLAFINGALVCAVWFARKHSSHSSPAIAGEAVAATPKTVEAPRTVSAPPPAAEPEPPSTPVASPAPKATVPAVLVKTPVATPLRRAVATRQRDREKAALARFPKLPAAARPTNWVDPFAD